jgi:hypothetical protein
MENENLKILKESMNLLIKDNPDSENIIRETVKLIKAYFNNSMKEIDLENSIIIK